MAGSGCSPAACAGAVLALAIAGFSPTVKAQTAESQGAAQTARLSSTQLLAFANRARDEGRFEIAEAAYRALFADPSVQVRSEARFRLAMLYVGARRLSQAAVLFREILDEQPDAQRVRLELAHVLDLMGDEVGARRALREAQAGKLPPEVARFVDRYSAALRAQKPLGASFDLALAPDSNINRATRSSTLGTVFGDFVLDDEARQRSGIGLALRGQAYARLPIGASVNLLAKLSGSADLYRAHDFNDIAVAATVGPELRLGADRLSLEGGALWRFFGGRPYSRAVTAEATYLHPLGRKAQLRAVANAALIDNRRNSLLDGHSFSATLGYERAISGRSGAGLTVSIDRQATRDPGYATWGWQTSAFAYRDLGALTLVGTLGMGRLKADRRILLYPDRRSDRNYRASLGATFRAFRIASFAPFIRATFERNRSSLEIHDYRRLRTEFGFTRSF